MIRPDGADEPVLGQRAIARLQQFLQRRLVVLGRHAVAATASTSAELAHDERARVLDAAVEIDRRDQRFVAVGQQRLLAAAAGLLLAAAEQQVIAELQPLGLPRQRRGRDQRRLRLRLLPFVEARETRGTAGRR